MKKFILKKYAVYLCTQCGSELNPLLIGFVCPNCGSPEMRVDIRQPLASENRQPFATDDRQHGGI